MTFLNPALLIGLVSAAIPILIHFIQLRKKKQVEFSSIALLTQIQKSSMKKFKLMQWILLLLRCLAIFFLVASFTKPVVEGLGSSEIPVSNRLNQSAFIVIDGSASMNYKTDDGQSLWSLAKRAALKSLDEYNDDDEVFFSIGEQQMGLPMAIGEIKNIVVKTLPPISGDPLLLQITNAIRTLTTAKHLNKELIVISDFQETNEGTKDSLITSLATSNIKAIFISVSPLRKENVAIESTEILTKLFEPKQPLRILSKLVNYSPKEKTIKTKLYFNEKLASEQTVIIQPNASTNVLFTAIPTDIGFIKGRVEIEDDAYMQDNFYYFSLYIPQKVKTLLVYHDRNNAEFIQTALESVSDTSFFAITFLAEKELDSKNFLNYEYLIFCDSETITDNTIQKTQAFLQSGGGVLICIPPQLQNTTKYNQLLQIIGAGKISLPPINHTKIVSLNIENELFENIFLLKTTSQEKLVPAFTSIATMASYQKSPKEINIIETSSGAPFSTFLQTDKGKAVIFTSLLNNKSTDFIFQPIYAPLLFRIIFLSVNQSKDIAHQFELGKTTTVHIAPSKGNDYKIIRPMGDFFIPTLQNQKMQKLLEINSKNFYDIGTYSLNENNAIISMISINANPQESTTAILSNDTISAWMKKKYAIEKNYFVSAVSTIDNISSVIQKSRYGASIWKFFLIIAILFLVVEGFLGRKAEV